MLGPQEVIDLLDGVEGLQRHLHEGGIPVVHGAIPQPGTLQGQELTACQALVGDEGGLGIDVAL